jgi:hypothetical protein
MPTALVADSAHDELARQLGLTPPLPALTPWTLWARVLGVQTRTIGEWAERGLWPRPVYRSERRVWFATREVLEHIARQQEGRADA